nr:hypothetical protein [Tanacetum cinerariifolium]
MDLFIKPSSLISLPNIFGATPIPTKPLATTNGGHTSTTSPSPRHPPHQYHHNHQTPVTAATLPPSHHYLHPTIASPQPRTPTPPSSNPRTTPHHYLLHALVMPPPPPRPRPSKGAFGFILHRLGCVYLLFIAPRRGALGSTVAQKGAVGFCHPKGVRWVYTPQEGAFGSGLQPKGCVGLLFTE